MPHSDNDRNFAASASSVIGDDGASGDARDGVGAPDASPESSDSDPVDDVNDCGCGLPTCEDCRPENFDSSSTDSRIIDPKELALSANAPVGTWQHRLVQHIAAREAEVAALRAERDEFQHHMQHWGREYDRMKAEVERMRPVVEAAVRRRIAWHKDDDDAENIAADRSEDAAVDAYRATSEQETTDA